ncbi:hypothetical protein Dda_6414 [Drechslerella dactyloides]|uniref:Uncharacterized protein n=1 Tax=Drechslerella dactyloides TaxID=74499 RepID=A0AAD6ITI8_DREDA|nr:hypothetical protein Dda_6414 [Drechslerella dactyloides]
MSRDLFGDFGDFQNATPTSNNAFAPAPAFPVTASTPGARPKSQNFSDLLGLFDAKPASAPSYQPAQHVPTGLQSGMPGGMQSGLMAPRPPMQAASSEAIISGLAFKSSTPEPSSTTLFTTSPQQNAVNDDDDDDFGDFAEEPLPSANPTFGPFTNLSSSPPPKPSAPPPLPSADLASLAGPQSPQPSNPINPSTDTDDFGQFIYTPRIPTPPPQQPAFSLSSNLTNPNHLHPSQPPPPLHALLPLLTTHLLSPLPFLTRLKPLSYPAKQRLLSTNTRVKSYFTSLLLTAHVAGRLIASKRVRARRPYKSPNSSTSLSRPSKTSLAKDDREIAECVREYADLVGSLRAVVRGMGLQVPDLSLDMPLSASPPAAAVASKRKPGSSPAGKDEFCWLCGLSPLDKIPKLKEDDGVLSDDTDITGKSRWTPGWGHRSCKNWWDACAKDVKL